jgi:peroxiredoxin
LPGFINNIDQVRAKGYEVVACVSVNDAFVTDAWGKSVNAEGKVRMLADPNAVFTKVILESFRMILTVVLFFYSFQRLFTWIKKFLL